MVEVVEMVVGGDETWQAHVNSLTCCKFLLAIGDDMLSAVACDVAQWTPY